MATEGDIATGDFFSPAALRIIETFLVAMVITCLILFTFFFFFALMAQGLEQHAIRLSPITGCVTLLINTSV